MPKLSLCPTSHSPYPCRYHNQALDLLGVLPDKYKTPARTTVEHEANGGEDEAAGASQQSRGEGGSQQSMGEGANGDEGSGGDASTSGEEELEPEGPPQHIFHGDPNGTRRELERLLWAGRAREGATSDAALDDGESIPLADLRQEHGHGPLSGFYITRQPLVGRYLIQLVVERDGNMEVGARACRQLPRSPGLTRTVVCRCTALRLAASRARSGGRTWRPPTGARSVSRAPHGCPLPQTRTYWPSFVSPDCPSQTYEEARKHWLDALQWALLGRDQSGPMRNGNGRRLRFAHVLRGSILPIWDTLERSVSSKRLRLVRAVTVRLAPCRDP